MHQTQLFHKNFHTCSKKNLSEKLVALIEEGSIKQQRM
jgi:hypothetical protein